MKRRIVPRKRAKLSLFEWKCRACKNKTCPFSPVCDNLPPPQGNNQISPILEKAFRLMRDLHHYPGLRLSKLAEACHVSVRELQLLFKKELNCTFSECLRCIRAGHARQIRKKDPTITVPELMRKVGFLSKTGYYLAQKALNQQSPQKSP